jgi:broad specificity phosphatase PhoE
MSTRLLLIRHGETDASAADRFSGEGNVHLTGPGRQQVELLSRRLAQQEITALYSSPADRALETASILAQPHALTPLRSADLREISVGHWEGLTYTEVRDRFPAELAAWEVDPVSFAAAGGETGIDVLSRALPAVRRMVMDHGGGTVIVVSHSGALRLVVSSLLGFDPRRYRNRLVLSPASLSILEFEDPAQARLVLYNDISHYATPPSRVS